jgi:hypothetical protein
MKNLLIGAFSNYNWNQLKPWVLSAKRNIENCEIALIMFNCDFDTYKKLVDEKIRLVVCGKVDNINERVYNKSNIPPHVERFVYLYEYLKSVEYNMVLTTDTRDVVFQHDPFVQMEKLLGDKKLICTTECLKYVDEPWGNENLLNTFGDYVYSQFKDNVIYNVGVFGGYAEYVRDLAINLFVNSINRPIPIVDQAVFNQTINTKPYSDIFKFCTLNDAFSVNLGTTNDPSKYEYFKPKMTENEAQMIDDTVCNDQGTSFSIVHQYDRVPDWNEIVLKGACNESYKI